MSQFDIVISICIAWSLKRIWFSSAEKSSVLSSSSWPRITGFTLSVIERRCQRKILDPLSVCDRYIVLSRMHRDLRQNWELLLTPRTVGHFYFRVKTTFLSLGSAFTKPNGKPCRGRARPSEVVYVTWAERVRRTAIGYSSLPEVVCCKSCFGSESSKGNLPQTIVYKTTPRLQTSLAIPSYGIPIRQQRMPIKNCNSWKVLNRGVLHF